MTIQTGGRQILIHGLTLILAGLLWGFAPPVTPFPRLALGAHIQFETNGLLFMAVGILLLTVPNRVGRKASWVMVASVWLTWLIVLSEVANSWWGTSQLLPIAAKQAGATGAAPWQELIVKLCHSRSARLDSLLRASDCRIHEVPAGRVGELAPRSLNPSVGCGG
jgi:hydroxylaminobenzene mutase